MAVHGAIAIAIVSTCRQARIGLSVNREITESNLPLPPKKKEKKKKKKEKKKKVKGKKEKKDKHKKI